MRPPTAAAGVEAIVEGAVAAAVEGMGMLVATVLAGHMMMIPPLSSPRFVRLVRLLASARMVKVVEVDDCSAGFRSTMMMPSPWYPFFFLLRVFKLAQIFCLRYSYVRSRL